MNSLTETDNILEIAESAPKFIVDWCKKCALDHRSMVEDTAERWSMLDDHMEIPEDIYISLQDWIHFLNLPDLEYAVLFQKRRLEEQENHSLHIDYNKDHDEPARACLNIPIENYEQTSMDYWSGKYETQKKYTNHSSDYAENKKSPGIDIPFLIIDWQENPVLAESYSVTQVPHLCRIDVPHSVTAHNDYRVILSLRFKNNPEFDYIKDCYKKRKKYE